MAAKPMSRAEKWVMWLVGVPAMIALMGYCSRQLPDDGMPNPAVYTLKPGLPVYITSETGRRPILKSRDDLERARKLIADGIAQQRPDLLRELVACTVTGGTRVSRLSSAGLFADKIMVAEGPDVGCEGYVWSDWLTNSGAVATSTSNRPPAPVPTGNQGSADRR